MRKAKFISLIAALLSLAGVSSADVMANEPYPSEFWKNDEQGWVVKTAPCDTGLCAYLVDFSGSHDRPAGDMPRDVHNPDPTRRDTPLCGLPLMGGFKPSKHADGSWEGGWVYDPDSGKTYSGTISVVDSKTVKLRGYIGVPLFGKTLTLHREEAVAAHCEPRS
jgi:uncharacterized protein (DUF2147 family)